MSRCGCLAGMLVVGVLMLPGVANAQKREAPPVDSFTYTQNLHPQGFSPMGNTPNLPGLTFTANSDLAFQGKLAFHGHYDGFRIINIAAPANPREISFTTCAGNQGDLVVYGDILVRSWNSPAPAGATCDGQPVSTGFEGAAHLRHQQSRRPGVDRQRRDQRAARRRRRRVRITHRDRRARSVERPSRDLQPVRRHMRWWSDLPACLRDPAGRSVESNDAVPIPLVGAAGCHDSGVILGDVNLLACASGAAANVYDIGENVHPGGSLTSPVPLYRVAEPGVCNVPDDPANPNPQRPCNGNWHSAAFTWDGEVLILGWEPGGGSQPECEATDPSVKKSWFFYDAHTGAKLGQFELPRPQSSTENCTIHNYNVIPTDKRYVLVGGNDQAGISVVDFTDPANATEVAFADPAPLVPTQLGGDWSTYYYTGRIYESDITQGLLIWNLSGKWDARAKRLPYLNPQTSEFTLASP